MFLLRFPFHGIRACGSNKIKCVAAYMGRIHNSRHIYTAMQTLSHTEILAAVTPTTVIIVLVLILLIFGGKKLPELARGLGKARREFKRASEEIDEEVKSAIEADERADVRRKLIEEEERKKIRERIEAEERAKLENK